MQGQPWLHSKSETKLDCMRPCIKSKTKNQPSKTQPQIWAWIVWGTQYSSQIPWMALEHHGAPSPEKDPLLNYGSFLTLILSLLWISLPSFSECLAYEIRNRPWWVKPRVSILNPKSGTEVAAKLWVVSLSHLNLMSSKLFDLRNYLLVVDWHFSELAEKCSEHVTI